METLWYVLVVLMLVGYVLLDGFDLGAGALSIFVAPDEASRRQILQSIGPVWDGNEVWLLAAGGTLFYAFPLLYASGFSGFYLPLNIVLWLLIFRALGIEFRTHLIGTVWRDFFDGAFWLASILLIIFFGAALGNVMRGVPLGADHYFFLALWTDFRPGAQPGILDWYTILCALATLAATTLHGALYLIVKTSGDLNERLRATVRILWPTTLLLAVAALLATIVVRPALLNNYRANPAGWLIPACVIAALFGIVVFTRTRREKFAFLSSCAFIIATLGGAALALYPTLLPASGDPANAITIQNAAAGNQSLSAGLVWWSAGMLIAVGYFVFVYTMFKGKVRDQPSGHGY
jgi:cytochrome d ubiquinol oxidase subunit II